MNEPYFVEVEDGGCLACKHGETWRVVGPDGVALSRTFCDLEDAEEWAELLNIAFDAGMKTKQAELVNPDRDVSQPLNAEEIKQIRSLLGGLKPVVMTVVPL